MRLKSRGPKGDEVEKLAQQPDLDPLTDRVVRDIFRCWNDSGPNRQLGFGVLGCIPKDVVIAWCEREGLDRETTDIYWAVIQLLDSDRVEREEANRRMKARKKK